MLKGASLLYATVIALIIAILCGSLILFTYFKLQERATYSIQERVCSNVLSGIYLLMNGDDRDSGSAQKVTDLYGNGTDSVSLKKINWGAYNVIVCSAFTNKKRINKAAIVGNLCLHNDSIALYLADANKPLFLCGETAIKGTCCLPAAGVKRGYIEGKNYFGSVLVDGVIKQSLKTIPVISPKLISYLETLVNGKQRNTDSIVSGAPSNGVLINSFFHRTVYIHSQQAITLSRGTEYTGNIIICSDKLVTLQAGCIINDVIICAPFIKVEENVRGIAQIFASDSIYISKNCAFRYPSVIGLISNKVSVGKVASLILNEGDSISGAVFADNEMPSTQKQVYLQVNKDAVISGDVYTNGTLDLKGTIYGFVTCNRITLKTMLGQYDNYLLDATIDAKKVSKNFVGSLLCYSKQKAIAKWVY
jgi:hypothetical protein